MTPHHTAPLPAIVPVALVLFALAGLAACSQGNAPTAAVMPAPTEVTALDTPPPSYPEVVACRGIGGTTTLQITIGTDGRTRDWQQVAGSGNADLDAAALAAVKAWRFQPATRNGQAIESKIQVPVTFNPPQELPSDCYQYGPRSGG